MGLCKVKDCFATDCKFNRKKKCILEFVTIDKNARCASFKKDNIKNLMRDMYD